ncbi:hypothetical protein M569_02177 [Genlisea aurea]|uniref:Uncharacterized protein n=1 Tax=Genlisea aurea TaxID=192259 RepID=S8CZU3_9LAMI|nr:hypothetical protein M569_02177 [Genlisea aurea]
MTKTTFLVFNNYEDSKQELWKLAFDMIEESGFNTRLVKDDELSRIGFKLFLEINTVVVLEADADLPKAILVLNRSAYRAY